MIGFAAEKLVELQVGSKTRPAHGEKKDFPFAQRNSWRARGLGDIYSGHFDPLGRRSGQGNEHERHLQKPDAKALRRDLRQGDSLLSGPSKATGHTYGINATYLKVRRGDYRHRRQSPMVRARFSVCI